MSILFMQINDQCDLNVVKGAVGVVENITMSLLGGCVNVTIIQQMFYRC
jgi:hypothetical protein